MKKSTDTVNTTNIITLEQHIRNEFNELIDYVRTKDTSYYGEDDYLHLFNHTTIEEENEIKEILKNIRIGLERLVEIQDDCYGR